MRIRSQEQVGEMQCGVMPEKGTTEVFFIVRQMMEEHRVKKKRFYLAFLDIQSLGRHLILMIGFRGRL